MASEDHQRNPPVPVCGIGASAGGVEALQPAPCRPIWAWPTWWLSTSLRIEGLTLVAVTGFGHREAVPESSGFDDRLVKPVSEEQLIELLESLPVQDRREETRSDRSTA